MGHETVVAITDAGGRGSVLVEAYAKSRQVDRILAFPGNDLMRWVAQGKAIETFPNIKSTNVQAILEACQFRQVTLLDVCQDNAVAAGLVNEARREGILTVGPTREAGQIESDKIWAREFGRKIGLPQPDFKVCESASDGMFFINHNPDVPRFIKAAGLAEGKGALPAKNRAEAAMRMVELERKFPEVAKRFLIEEWLLNDDGTPGEEFSMFVLTDGGKWQIIGNAQDHKRIFNNDEGENTGGMGCSSPPSVLTPEVMRRVEDEIINKTIKGLAENGTPYEGILYLGGILVTQGGKLNPYVVEWNARWGDPEAEAILPGIQNDWFEVMKSLANGSVEDMIETDGKYRVAITGATRGYPGDCPNNLEIYGLDDLMDNPNIKLYPAGIRRHQGRNLTAGGRLFYVVGVGDNVIEARQAGYGGMAGIFVEGNNLHLRTDIGYRDVVRLWHK